MKLYNTSFTFVAAAIMAVAAVSAQANFIVAPNSSETVEGDINNTFPLFVLRGMRYQQVYAASEFSALGNGNFLTQIAFRPDNRFHVPFSRTISDVEISLSTTSGSPNSLSETFADNIGADNTQVFSGALSLSSADLPGPGNTRAFDVVIDFQTPFFYDPAQGNLLLDIRNNSPEVNFIIGLSLDAVSGSNLVSRVAGLEGSPTALTGRSSSLGLVTRFTAVPEPSSLALFSITMLAVVRRRGR